MNMQGGFLGLGEGEKSDPMSVSEDMVDVAAGECLES